LGNAERTWRLPRPELDRKGCGQNPNQDPDVQGDRKEVKPRHL
jgi:hypothetical protein